MGYFSYSDLDLNRNQLLNARLENRASSFSSPLDGMLYFDSQGGSRRIRYVMEQTATPDAAKYQYVPRQDLTETISGLWTFSRSTNAPFAVISGSAKVTYLDADMLDGRHSSAVNDANTVALRDANGRLQFSDPSADLDGVNFLFMRNYVAGLVSRREACRTVATTALAATRSSNTLTANANGSINTVGIDGLTNLAINNRILVVAQTAGQDNGIYIISSLGDAGNPWVMQRSADCDTSAEVINGLWTVTTDGTNYKGTEWLLMTADPITLNTTVLVWFQIGASTSAIAGNGMVRVGNTYHVAQSAAYTANSLPYAASTSTLGFVSNNASANRTFLMQVSSEVPTWDSLYVGDIPTLGITKMSMNTARLLGRTTASTGAVEEITPSATNFTFTGQALNTIQNIHTGAAPQFSRLGLGVAASGSAPLRLYRSGTFDFDPVSTSQLVLQLPTDSAGGISLEICSTFAATRLGVPSLMLRGPATSDFIKYLYLCHDGTNGNIVWATSGLLFTAYIGSMVTIAKFEYNKATFYNSVNLDYLTASQWVKTDGSKNLVSVANLAIGDMQMSTARLLGRTTASTGAVEEISPSATNFTLTGLALNTIQNIHTAATPQFARLGLGVAADGSDPLTIGTTFAVKSTSNVGIGTTTVIDLLHLQYSSNSVFQGITVRNIGLTAGASGSDREMGSVVFMAPSDATRIAKVCGYVPANASGINMNALKFIVNAATTNTTAMVIREDGKVGIGTLSPVSVLSINGGLHVGGDSDAGDNNLLVDGAITVSGLSASLLVATDASKNLVSVAAGTYSRRYATTFTGTQYNGSGYQNIQHSLATEDVLVQVFRTKDEAGSADTTHQTILCDVHRGSYSNSEDTSYIHIHFGNAPNNNEEFRVLVLG